MNPLTRFWNWLWDEDHMAFILGGLVVLIVFGGVLYMAVKDEQSWKLYVQAHGCTISEKIPSDVIVTTAINPSTGQSFIATTTTSSKTRWVCDNGVVWR